MTTGFVQKGKAPETILMTSKRLLMKVGPGTTLGIAIIPTALDIGDHCWKILKIVKAIEHGQLNYISIGVIQELERVDTALKSFLTRIGKHEDNGGMVTKDNRLLLSTNSTDGSHLATSNACVTDIHGQSPSRAGFENFWLKKSTSPVMYPGQNGGPTSSPPASVLASEEESQVAQSINQ